MEEQTKTFKWRCGNCKKDCGVDPEVLVKQGAGVSAWLSFCSNECYLKAIEEHLKKTKSEKEHQFRCCCCHKDCNDEPEVLIKQTGIFAYLWFCSYECYFAVIQELARIFQSTEENGAIKRAGG